MNFYLIVVMIIALSCGWPKANAATDAPKESVTLSPEEQRVVRSIGEVVYDSRNSGESIAKADLDGLISGWSSLNPLSKFHVALINLDDSAGTTEEGMATEITLRERMLLDAVEQKLHEDGLSKEEHENKMAVAEVEVEDCWGESYCDYDAIKSILNTDESIDVSAYNKAASATLKEAYRQYFPEEDGDIYAYVKAGDLAPNNADIAAGVKDNTILPPPEKYPKPSTDEIPVDLSTLGFRGLHGQLFISVSCFLSANKYALSGYINTLADGLRSKKVDAKVKQLRIAHADRDCRTFTQINSFPHKAPTNRELSTKLYDSIPFHMGKMLAGLNIVHAWEQTASTNPISAEDRHASAGPDATIAQQALPIAPARGTASGYGISR